MTHQGAVEDNYILNRDWPAMIRYVSFRKLMHASKKEKREEKRRGKKLKLAGQIELSTFTI